MLLAVRISSYGGTWKVWRALKKLELLSAASQATLTLLSSKHLRVFLESLRQSSDIFGNSRKMFGNVHLAFGTILENLWKSSEGGRKSSENNQKRRHQHAYIIKRTLHGGLKI